MATDIGIATVVRMGTGALPNSAANGGADTNLTAVTGDTGWLTAFNVSSPQGTVDITQLGASDFTRRFIAELINNSASGTYNDDLALTFKRRCETIRNGKLHPKGRSKVDIRVLVGGAVTGQAQLDFTVIITNAGVNINPTAPVGGAFDCQIDGAVTYSTQP